MALRRSIPGYSQAYLSVAVAVAANPSNSSLSRSASLRELARVHQTAIPYSGCFSVFIWYFTVESIVSGKGPPGLKNLEEDLMNIQEKDDYTLLEMPARFSPDWDQTKNSLPSSVLKEGRNFVLDMENATTIHSASIRFISQLHKEITDAKGKLIIVNASQEAENVLRNTKLDRVIPLFSSIIDFEMESGSQ
jgi:anti-anti-sigma factor